MTPQRSTPAPITAASASRAVGRGIVEHRCDRCGAQAHVHVELQSGRDLALCGHHGRQHEAALIAAGAVIRDHTYLLNTSR